MSTRRFWTSGRRTGIPASKGVEITEGTCSVQSLLLASSGKCMTTQTQPSLVILIVIPMEAMRVDHARRYIPSSPYIEAPNGLDSRRLEAKG
jgi:hypothetical protein